MLAESIGDVPERSLTLLEMESIEVSRFTNLFYWRLTMRMAELYSPRIYIFIFDSGFYGTDFLFIFWLSLKANLLKPFFIWLLFNFML